MRDREAECGLKSVVFGHNRMVPSQASYGSSRGPQTMSAVKTLTGSDALRVLLFVPTLLETGQAIKLCWIGFQYLGLGGSADIRSILQRLGRETLAVAMRHVGSKHQLPLSD